MKLNYKEILGGYSPSLFGNKRLKSSAVVIPIVNIDGEDMILFQVRGARLKAQPGDVSFPGGGIDKDETAEEAAIREFNEELGEFNSSKLKIIGEFDTYVSSTRGLIYSFVGELDDVDLSIKNKEVEELFLVPVKFFKETKPQVYRNRIDNSPGEDFPYQEMGIAEDYRWGVQSHTIYFYKYNGYLIWGITAKIVSNFIKML